MFVNWRLRRAVQQGTTEDVRALVANGADLRHHDRDGFTPLMHAVNIGHAGLARTLVKLGADVNAGSSAQCRLHGFPERLVLTPMAHV